MKFFSIFHLFCYCQLQRKLTDQIFLYMVFLSLNSSCETKKVYVYNITHKSAYSIIGDWKLRHIYNNSIKLSPSQIDDITIKIRDNHHIYGYSGCNNFSGVIKIKNNVIEFNDFMATSRGCIGNQNIEEILFNILKKVNNYEINNNILYLKYDEAVLIAYNYIGEN